MGTKADLGGRYEFNSGFLAKLTEDFEEGDWGLRDDDLNAAHWDLGHLVSSRRGALRLMGKEIQRDDWEDAIGLGGEREGFKQAPPVADLMKEFAELGTNISRTIDELGKEGLAREIDAVLPDASQTIGEGVFGLYMHECVHLGHFTLFRRLLGKVRFM